MEKLHGSSKEISRTPKEKLLRSKQKIHRREKTVEYQEEVYANWSEMLGKTTLT